MKKTNIFLCCIILFSLMAGAAGAASFDAVAAPVKDKIVVDEVAEFNFTIVNNLGTNEEFSVKKAGYPFWDMYTKPLQNPISFRVPAHSSVSFALFVNPQYITSVDTYTLEAGVVRDRTGEEIKVPVTIGIKSIEPLIGGYIPTVIASVGLTPENLDPREELSIQVNLNNQNVINYTNLTLRLESGLFKEDIYFTLDPKEDKTIDIKKKFDAMTEPQIDNLIITVLRGDRIIVSPITKELTIKSYSIEKKISEQSSFLKIKGGIEITSNDPSYVGEVKIETTSFKNLFTSTNPRSESEKEGGKNYLIWNIDLAGTNTMTVYVTENYRPLVIIIVLAIAAIGIYFIFRGPMVVRKSVANIGIIEGGISAAKVIVRVKNRSQNQLTAIEIIDHVPHIAHVEKELSIGSMQPRAVLHHPRGGMVIKWTIETLDSGDERVLSYRMRSRLPILGEFTLPSASARTKLGNKMILTNSNRVTVGG